jgi:1,4-alpha-glucan branching enzyme
VDRTAELGCGGLGGGNVGNLGAVRAEAVPWNDRPQSIRLTLPPLAGLVLEPRLSP